MMPVLPPLFFPLDEELELGRGDFSPWLVEQLARLGAWVPFPHVPQEFAAFTGVALGRETARRRTEAAGAALVAVEEAAVARLERAPGELPQGPPVQQVSVDGAMVPLVHGEWAEVKLLAVGTVTPQPTKEGGTEPHARELTYFGRLTEAATFRRLAHLETHRRGIATAGTVCAVMDGAEWLQHWIDGQRPDAVRILDFAHAAEHLAKAAHAVWGVDSAPAAAWLGRWCHELKWGDPDAVLEALAALPVRTAKDPAAAAATCEEVREYLTKRRPQIAYADFLRAGYPIGSGAVESGNKLVMEARLKGSGMHWARANVNPMVALRAALCSGRWAEAWDQIWQQLRAAATTRRRQQRVARTPAPAHPAPVAGSILAAEPARRLPARPRTVVDGRPTAAHPWRQSGLQRRAG
jgi:hypothetical protein